MISEINESIVNLRKSYGIDINDDTIPENIKVYILNLEIEIVAQSDSANYWSKKYSDLKQMIKDFK